MEQKQTARTCPACGSTEYQFRSRKKISTKSGHSETTETKYRCKSCEHEWKVRTFVAEKR
jgi:transposase-like protein